MSEAAYSRICMHCGSVGAQRIGICDECGTPVCEKCGNSQISLNDRKILHDSCLRHCAETHFSMIKFVK